eukprot:ctg_1196.g387
MCVCVCARAFPPRRWLARKNCLALQASWEAQCERVRTAVKGSGDEKVRGDSLGDRALDGASVRGATGEGWRSGRGHAGRGGGGSVSGARVEVFAGVRVVAADAATVVCVPDVPPGERWRGGCASTVGRAGVCRLPRRLPQRARHVGTVEQARSGVPVRSGALRAERRRQRTGE